MVYLTDQHFHCRVSRDSEAPLLDMIMASRAAGVRQLCVTDHCDLVDWDTLEPDPARNTASARLAAEWEACRERIPADVTVRLGIELGEGNFDPADAARLAADPLYDFVLGSHHITREQGDYYHLRSRDPADWERAFDMYLDNLLLIARADYFDCMAHIGYLRRYAVQNGVDMSLTLARHGDRLETLLRTLIANGRGIEINCSGLRDGCGPFPSEELLRFYRALGGELLTIGSDAHTPTDAAKCLREGHELAQSLGFRYISIYTRRKPEFIRL